MTMADDGAQAGFLTRKRREMAEAVQAGRVRSDRTVTWYLDGEPVAGQSGRALRELSRAGVIAVVAGSPDKQGATQVTVTERGVTLLLPLET